MWVVSHYFVHVTLWWLADRICHGRAYLEHYTHIGTTETRHTCYLEFDRVSDIQTGLPDISTVSNFNLYAHVSVQCFSLIWRDSFTKYIDSTVLLPVTVVLSTGYGGLAPMYSWLPEVAKLRCVFNFLTELWEFVWSDLHTSVSPAYCSYIWLLLDLPYTKDMFILHAACTTSSWSDALTLCESLVVLIT